MKEMTDGELARYLYNHLVYEVEMLRHAYERLGTFKDGRDFSMALECFALHARGLVEFLSKKPKGKNDVRASLFVAPGFRSPRKDGIQNALDMIDPQMMHAGRQRTIDPNDKLHTNHATKLLDWIEDALAKFNEALRSPFESGWMPPGQSPARLPVTEQPSATNYLTYLTTTITYVTGAMTNIKRVKP
jgi:hypothetical protein